ncbi:MAG: hypothetical protein AAF399_00085 [Bacteroidota bacterium]
MNLKSLLWAIVAMGFLSACAPDATEESAQLDSTPAIQVADIGINPPLENVQVPIQRFTVEASEGTELTLENGTSIRIPAGVLVDANNQPVQGKVDLSYREFHDAADILMSGIPMQYDSAGQTFVFQTAGMVEIRANQNGRPVFIAEGKAIDLDLNSYVPEHGYNLYQLDEETQNWSYLETSQAESVMDPSQGEEMDWASDPEIAAIMELAEEEIPAEPYEPKKLAEDATPFDFDADYSQFPALAPYKELVWQYAQIEEEGYVNPNTAEWIFGEVWANVSVQQHPKRNGIFYFTLRNKEKEAKMLVTPVVEEENYAQTQELFAELRRKQEQRRQEILAARERMRTQRQLAAKRQRIERAFQISSFGIYNCDRLWNRPQMVLAADFRFDEFEIPVDPSIIEQVYLVMPEDNAVIPYARGGSWNGWSQFKYAPNTKNMIFAFLPGNEVAVFSVEDFAEQKPSGDFVFQMKEAGTTITSPADLRALIVSAG